MANTKEICILHSNASTSNLVLFTNETALESDVEGPPLDPIQRLAPAMDEPQARSAF